MPSNFEFDPSNALSSNDPSFSFQDDLHQSILNERLLASLDLGPTDSIAQDQLQEEYRFFYGSSPLSSVPTSPTRSRSASPVRLPTPSNGTPSTSIQPLPEPSKPKTNQQIRKRKKSHELHRLKWQREREEKYPGSSSAFKNHISTAIPIKTEFDTAKIPIASSGFVAKHDEEGPVCGLKELLGKRGFKLIKWDGKNSFPILDGESRVVVALLGKPKDTDWDEVTEGAFEAVRRSAARCKFPKKAQEHQRGQFPAMSMGVSHGGGTKKPGNLYHGRTNRAELDALLKNKHIARIAGFASGGFSTWAPKLFQYYVENFEALLQSDPSLRRNFHNSWWASITINYGPRTVTCKHIDYANLPFGLCAITPLGHFNPTKGGHIVLWSLKLVIEFPAGSTALIPSAVVPHSNTPISKHETRCSVTQYSAGGTFRWVAHNFKKSDDYFGELAEDEVQWEKEVERTKARCKLALTLFSTIEELQEFHQQKKTRKAGA